MAMVSMRADETYVLDVLRLGAAGCDLKDAGPAEVMAAVCEESAGRRYLTVGIWPAEPSTPTPKGSRRPRRRPTIP